MNWLAIIEFEQRVAQMAPGRKTKGVGMIIVALGVLKMFYDPNPVLDAVLAGLGALAIWTRSLTDIAQDAKNSIQPTAKEQAESTKVNAHVLASLIAIAVAVVLTGCVYTTVTAPDGTVTKQPHSDYVALEQGRQQITLVDKFTALIHECPQGVNAEAVQCRDSNLMVLVAMPRMLEATNQQGYWNYKAAKIGAIGNISLGVTGLIQNGLQYHYSYLSHKSDNRREAVAVLGANKGDTTINNIAKDGGSVTSHNLIDSSWAQDSGRSFNLPGVNSTLYGATDYANVNHGVQDRGPLFNQNPNTQGGSNQQSVNGGASASLSGASAPSQP